MCERELQCGSSVSWTWCELLLGTGRRRPCPQFPIQTVLPPFLQAGVLKEALKDDLAFLGGTGGHAIIAEIQQERRPLSLLPSPSLIIYDQCSQEGLQGIWSAPPLVLATASHSAPSPSQDWVDRIVKKQQQKNPQSLGFFLPPEFASFTSARV